MRLRVTACLLIYMCLRSLSTYVSVSLCVCVHACLPVCVFRTYIVERFQPVPIQWDARFIQLNSDTVSSPSIDLNTKQRQATAPCLYAVEHRMALEKYDLGFPSGKYMFKRAIRLVEKKFRVTSLYTIDETFSRLNHAFA